MEKIIGIAGGEYSTHVLTDEGRVLFKPDGGGWQDITPDLTSIPSPK